ncbi:unnamed protein product [Schistosoma turkestanicum]|nr:unnamed protein product [Schistosoma turkestanicum]
MASIDTGSSCFTECLGSIIDQMCRKSSYSNAVKLINANYSNENETQSFTHRVVSVLKGKLIPYSLRRFLWPLALFTVAERTRSEFENPINWDGHKMRELETSARKNFGVLLASGTAKLGLTTPTCSKYNDIIRKTVKEITLELQLKFKNQQKQFRRFSEQSIKILNVFYTAKQIYDPLYIYWLLPIHFALNKDYMHELIKHFPDIPSNNSINSTDEGVQIYSFSLCLSLFIDIMNKKYGLYHTHINNMIVKTINNMNKLQCVQHIRIVHKEFILKNSNTDSSKSLEFEEVFQSQMMKVNDFDTGGKSNAVNESENSYLHRFLKQWFNKLFVGIVNSIALMFFWDQLILNSFNCDVMIEFAETLIVLLGSDILQVNNLIDMEQLFKHGPNELLTKDIIQTWNMIHLNKVLDDKYYKLNRLSGSFKTNLMEVFKSVLFFNLLKSVTTHTLDYRSITKEIQETSKKDVNFYLQEFTIHNIIVTTVTDSRKILSTDLFRVQFDYFVENEIKQSCLTESKPTIIFHGKLSTIYDNLNHVYSSDEDYCKNKTYSMTNYSYPPFIQTQSQMYITMFQFNMEQSLKFMIYPYKLWAREVINPIEQGTYPEISYDPAWTLNYLLIPFNYLFYHFYSLPIIETDDRIAPQLLHGSRISLRVYNPNLEAVPKVLQQPVIYITRSIQTKVLYKETIGQVDEEQIEEEQIEEKDIEDIEELSPPATPINDPWVPFKKLAPYERLMKPSSTSEPFCIYIDQLRFMPDNSTIFKVTGRLLNTKYDEELLDILIVPEENMDKKETSRSPVFSPNQRFIVNLNQNKTLSQNSLLFLRVYTLTLTSLEYVVVGNVLLKVFNSNGLLNIGGHQLRLRCEVPKPIAQNTNTDEVFYQADSLDNVPYIQCSTILIRLLPYTEEPLPSLEYRFRSYRSIESTPTNFEWVVYRQFESDENRKTDIRSVVKMILRREGEFDSSAERNDFLTPEYLNRYLLQRLSIKRNTTKNGIPKQMISAFPFFYRINDGFLLSLKNAEGLAVNEGDYIFGLAKVIRGSNTKLTPENKFYGFGSDDDLLFDRFDSTTSLENPIWEDPPQLTKPYYDSDALLIIQIFRVPLVFTIGGSINITKSGNWFAPPMVSRNVNKRQIIKLQRMHLLGWSFLRPFEWGFLRNGTHKLYLFKPPIRLRTLNKIQTKDEENSIMLNSDNFLENASLTIQLQSGRFLDFPEELKTDQQSYYSQILNNEHDTVNEYKNTIEQMKELNKMNLNSMAEFRAKTDTNWLQQGENGSDKLYAEIHEFLKNEVITLELQLKFKNQQKQYRRFSEQSIKILNVFYTAKQIYDPLYIYWLLPIHFALNKDYMHELIKHFPDIPSKDSINSTDEGVQIYSFGLCLSLFVDIMNRKYGLYHTHINNMIVKAINNMHKLQCVQHIRIVHKEFILKNSNTDSSKNLEFEEVFQSQMMNVNDFDTGGKSNTVYESENSYLHRFLKQWFNKLFVGIVNTIALMFFWDQLILNSFNCDVMIEFAETLIVLLGSDILQVNNLSDMEQLFKHGPNELLTKDIIQTWNMIHLDKVLDDKYYKLNRLSGKLISITKEIQETSKKDVNFYLQEFTIHNIIVTTVTDSRKKNAFLFPPR